MACWRHKAITQIIVDFSLVKLCGIHRRAVSLWVSNYCFMSLKVTLLKTDATFSSVSLQRGKEFSIQNVFTKVVEWRWCYMALTNVLCRIRSFLGFCPLDYMTLLWCTNMLNAVSQKWNKGLTQSLPNYRKENNDLHKEEKHKGICDIIY